MSFETALKDSLVALAPLLCPTQLRGGTINNDTGELLQDIPLAEALQKFFLEDFWKCSYRMPNGQRVRLLKNSDGTIMPTFWCNERQNWYPMHFTS